MPIDPDGNRYLPDDAVAGWVKAGRNPDRLVRTLRMLEFRSAFPETEDPVTISRAARIMRADDKSPLTMQYLGLAEGETDFSDMTVSLDEAAEEIHAGHAAAAGSAAAELGRRGRHAAP
jgi:hypothetical protein